MDGKSNHEPVALASMHVKVLHRNGGEEYHVHPGVSVKGGVAKLS